MNIIDAIQANREQRVALIDGEGNVITSFAIGKLTRMDSFSSSLINGKFKTLKDNVLIVGENPDGTKRIFNSKEEASGSVAKIYKEVEE